MPGLQGDAGGPLAPAALVDRPDRGVECAQERAVLLVGPPLATHAFPHFIHSVFPHRVIPAPAPSAVTTNLPGADG